MTHLLISPLKVWRGKTTPTKASQWFILNLNSYRNAHYLVLNRTKINYKADMKEQLALLPVITHPIHIQYRVFAGSKRLFDIGNVVSIHKKYFEDALVEAGKIADDNYNFVISSSEEFGGVDKHNPRVEIRIIEIPEGDSPYEHLIRFK